MEMPRGRARVLLVEDDEALLEAMKGLLDDTYDVTASSGGVDALARIDAGLLVDVVVLDLSMPVLDGAGVVRLLRGKGVTTPIMIVSGDEDVRARAQALGAAAWVRKPCGIAEVEGGLERILRSAGNSVSFAMP
jgi:DNA-binding response OmpR family regulator